MGRCVSLKVSRNLRINFVDKVCLITSARLNSQRLPNKMLKPFDDSTLFDICLAKMSNIHYIDKYAIVYEPELIEAASKYPEINTFIRSKESAEADGPVSLIWDWALDPVFMEYTHFIYINSCLPCLSQKSIIRFINSFSASVFDNMFAVKKIKDYIWNDCGELIYPDYPVTMMNTKDPNLKEIFIAAHCLYGGTLEGVRNNLQLGNFTKDNPALYTIDSKFELLDVDDEEDFRIAEGVYKHYAKYISYRNRHIS